MSNRNIKALVCLATSALLSGAAAGAHAQQTPLFTPGNLVVAVEGCGVYGGTCTSVPNGTGTNGGYGDNQAGPLTLIQFQPSGVSSVNYVNTLVFPQAGSGANLPVSGEYGSSSEGSLQLSGNGLYLTIAGYGINANTFNANPNAYSPTPNAALAQSSSIPSSSYTAIARVITLVDPYGDVNSATPVFNVYNTNNPRSVYTTDGISNAYISGQGSGCDTTGGVFYVPMLKTTIAPTAITGGDASSGNSSCAAIGYTGVVYQDTRALHIYGNTLYVSMDSTEGKSDNRSFIGTLGTPPATSLFVPPTQSSKYTTGPAQINGLGNSGGTGKETMTAATGNGLNAGLGINISPEEYLFAAPNVIYVADGGSPKQTSAASSVGDGGLQKWTNSSADGTGAWSLDYTLANGLNLVLNSSAAGTTGLKALTGKVVNGVAYLYATNYTIGDLDPSFLYGIADTLTATSNSSTFTQLAAAPTDSDFKGVAFAPTLAAGTATITTSPSGLTVSTSGAGCVAGTYTTPVTLAWTAGSSCDLSVASTQTVGGTQYDFSAWQDGTTATTDAVTAPSSSAVYTAAFKSVLTVTANNADKAQGAANPAFSASYSGFLNGDNASVLSGSPAFSTTATTSSPAGTYPIVPSEGTLSAANYTFSFVDGTLSVVGAPTVALTTTMSVSGSNAGGYTVTVTVSNTGNSAANNLALTTATLGGVAGAVQTALPSTITGGTAATATYTFPGSLGADGARVVGSFAGSYTGGTFSGSSRVVLP